MRIPYTSYKNSVLATILSIIGSLMGGFGIMLFVFGIFSLLSGKGEVIFGSIFLILPGIAFTVLARHIAERKQMKIISKTLREKGAESEISNSVNLALHVYNQYPTKRMQKYIAGLNPQAGQIIQEFRQKQKAKN